MCIGKMDPFIGQGINNRRFNLVNAIAAQVSITQIVCKNKNNIGSFQLPLGYGSEDGKRCQQQYT
jgi:hypothetical protein